MPGNHRCPTNRHVILQRHATGNCGAGSNDAMFADHTVVTNLDLVVELAAIANHRVIERATVNRRTGTNLDIIADKHSADLRNLDPLALIRRETETVGADDYTGMNDGISTNLAAGVDTDIRVQNTAITNANTIAQHTTGMNDHTLTQHNIRANAGVRPDTYTGRHL